jgi:hypothetical protein
MGDFFKNNKNDQEAAQKALQDAFKDKKDPWALDEERAKKRGGGGGGGSGNGGSGGNGGNGGSNNFNFGDWGDGFLKWLRNFLKAFAAAAAFFGFIIAFTFWEPLIKLVVLVFRTVLRLDSRSGQVEATDAQADLGNTNELGNVEEAVIGQWAGEDHPDVGASEEDDDEE